MRTFAILMMLLTLKSYGQYGSYAISMGKMSDISKLKSRPLIVVMEDTAGVADEKARKKIRDFNKYFPEIVKKHWKYNKKMIFKTYGEMVQLNQSGDTSHAVLHISVWTVRDAYSTTDRYEALLSISLIENVTDLRLPFIFYYVLPYPPFSSDPNKNPSEGELIIALGHLQLNLKGREKGLIPGRIRNEMIINAGLLKTKTLLIDERFIYTKWDAAKIKEFYPYNFQIVKKAEVDKAMVSADPKYAVFSFSPVHKGHFSTMYIIDAENNEIIFAPKMPQQFNGYINEKNLKEITKHLSTIK